MEVEHDVEGGDVFYAGAALVALVALLLLVQVGRVSQVEAGALDGDVRRAAQTSESLEWKTTVAQASGLRTRAISANEASISAA